MQADQDFPREAHALATDTRPFGARLKFWRGQRGLTQQHVASILNVTRETINRWEGVTSGTGVTSHVTSAPPSEAAACKRLRDAQGAAGETPGQDSAETAQALWVTYLREASSGQVS